MMIVEAMIRWARPLCQALYLNHILFFLRSKWMYFIFHGTDLKFHANMMSVHVTSS